MFGAGGEFAGVEDAIGWKVLFCRSAGSDDGSGVSGPKMFFRYSRNRDGRLARIGWALDVLRMRPRLLHCWDGKLGKGTGISGDCDE